MSKHVYIVWQYDNEPYEYYYNGIHKCFDTMEAAEAYVKANKGKVFPEDREPWDCGYSISETIKKHKLYGEDPMINPCAELKDLMDMELALIRWRNLGEFLKKEYITKFYANDSVALSKAIRETEELLQRLKENK